MFFRKRAKDFPDILDLIDIKKVSEAGLHTDFASQVSENRSKRLQKEKNKNAFAEYLSIAGCEIVGAVAGRVAYTIVSSILNNSNKISEKLDQLISEPLLTGTRVAQETLSEIDGKSSLSPQALDDLYHRLRFAIENLEKAYTLAGNQKDNREKTTIRTIQGLCEAHLPPRRTTAIRHLTPFLDCLDKEGQAAHKKYRAVADHCIYPVQPSLFSTDFRPPPRTRPSRPMANLRQPPGGLPMGNSISGNPYGDPFKQFSIVGNKYAHLGNQFSNANFPGSFAPGRQSSAGPRYAPPPKPNLYAGLERFRQRTDKDGTEKNRPERPSKAAVNRFKTAFDKRIKISDIVEKRKHPDFRISPGDRRKLNDAITAYETWQCCSGVAASLRQLCLRND